MDAFGVLLWSVSSWRCSVVALTTPLCVFSSFQYFFVCFVHRRITEALLLGFTTCLIAALEECRCPLLSASSLFGLLLLFVSHGLCCLFADSFVAIPEDFQPQSL